MIASAPLVIEAVVDEAEREPLVAAGKQLGARLEAATAMAWPVELRFRESIAAIGAPDRSTIVIASLLPEVERREEPIAVTEARWREHLAALDGRFPCILVCTIFRCITATPGSRRLGATPAIAERIRRLNLLAAELSHDAGIGVIDFDRVFAHVGARELATDYRLTGSMAADVAAHAIVSAVLAVALDDIVPPETQDRAIRAHGDVSARIRALTASRRQNGSR